MIRKSLLAAAGVLLLASCGAQSVDIPVVEDNIKSGVKEQNNLDVTVDCPDSVDWATGETFECDVTDADGGSTQAEVLMKDDEGNVSWKVG